RRQMRAPSEQQHVAGCETMKRNSDEMPRRSVGKRFLARRLRPVRCIRRRLFRLVADYCAPNATHETEAIAAHASQRGLVTIRRADPAPRFRDDVFSMNEHVYWRLAPLWPGSPGKGCAMMKSLPGMCGNPRKFTALLKRVRQVSNCLSQPAGTMNVSPGSTGSGIACHSTIRTAPALRWLFTSTLRPIFAPLLKVSFPAVNQPSSKSPSPLAVNVDAVSARTAAPTPRKAGLPRSTPQRASPRSAEQVAV